LTNLDVPQPLWLGRHHANGYVDREDIYFQGDIDELTFYRRALTEKEIQSIFKRARTESATPIRRPAHVSKRCLGLPRSVQHSAAPDDPALP
jgi:hypothetical protein